VSVFELVITSDVFCTLSCVLKVSLVKSFTADHDLSLQVTYQEATVPHVVVEKGDAQKGKD
jgi:hypothetical protein